MAKTRTSTQTQAARTNRNTDQRQAYTLEYAAAICPHAGLANNLSATFASSPSMPPASGTPPRISSSRVPMR